MSGGSGGGSAAPQTTGHASRSQIECSPTLWGSLGGQASRRSLGLGVGWLQDTGAGVKFTDTIRVQET